MWESNPPRALFAPRDGFEDRRRHRPPSAPPVDRNRAYPVRGSAELRYEIDLDPGVLGQAGGSHRGPGWIWLDEVLRVLRPAGVAEFGDERVEVETDGDYIAQGQPVVVVDVQMGRVVVEEVEDDGATVAPSATEE